jgi:acetylornithine deacetylase/succinyl-diaminopimelate desuccinylase-like protein
MGFSDFENPLSGAILAGSASLHVHMAGSNGRHSRPQQFDARAAIHGALKRLQAIDLALGLAAAPRFRDGAPRDMCGRPRPCKKFFDAALPIWSGAGMCPAFACGA